VLPGEEDFNNDGFLNIGVWVLVDVKVLSKHKS
jgi:hypothetical protein